MFYVDVTFGNKHINKETANFHVSYCLEGMEEMNYYVLILNFKKGEKSIFSPPNLIHS